MRTPRPSRTSREAVHRVGWSVTQESNLLGVVLPIAIAVAVLVVDVLEGPTPQYLGLAVATPLLAAAVAGPVRTAFVGASVIAGVHLTAYFQTGAGGDLVVHEPAHDLRMVFFLLATVLAVVVSRHRTLRTRTLLDLSDVADACQNVILRPVPDTIRSVRCAARYVSATDLARVGGDIIEVVDTSHGLRVLVGDARGKGTEAIRLSGAVLAAFREYAWRDVDLPTLAAALDGTVTREGTAEDFVTALLLEVHDDGTVHAVSCGHPAPFLVTPGHRASTPARELPVAVSPPLGLLDARVDVSAAHLLPGQRLALVTDGLMEARRPHRWYDRRSGEFLPAAAVLGRALSGAALKPGLDEVVEQVRRWTGGRYQDDVAVLVLERQTPAHPDPAGRPHDGRTGRHTTDDGAPTVASTTAVSTTDAPYDQDHPRTPGTSHPDGHRGRADGPDADPTDLPAPQPRPIHRPGTRAGLGAAPARPAEPAHAAHGGRPLHAPVPGQDGYGPGGHPGEGRRLTA